ncbi:uncharacterized protein LOC127245519 [Andrographis paniculata]|uniref:uncharacterized protein LOC127245519 n=1 Tax=Andrographis paniculata TaxID=175694 RepID=UPI0021E8841C|nr:uncharacterized protein LOC127245519 [Andrographis paniculata]
MVGSVLRTDSRNIKFCCSYGGRIIPRFPDGELRYHGGVTRVLSVNYSVSFSDLLVKMEELCGSPVSLIRCKLPTEDLDALVSITSDEDLANLIEEYDYASAAEEPPKSLKIRAFLSVTKSLSKKLSSPSSSSSSSSCSSDGSPPKSSFYYCGGGLPPRYPSSTGGRCVRKASFPAAYPVVVGRSGGEIPKRYVYSQYLKGSHGYGGEVFIGHSS